MHSELRYTGHPFIDVGIATITAFSGKKKPQEITEDDLQEVAEYLKDKYCHYKPVQNFIQVIFINSHFVQHAKTTAQREAYADQILFAFKQDIAAEDYDPRCTFFPELKPVMNAHRQHIPLLNGESITNFSALGSMGLPVSGLALLAIHAMPLGCFKCGHLMAFHQLVPPSVSNGESMNQLLARMALEENRKAISLMSLGSSDSPMPSYGSYARTRYVDILLRAKRETRRRGLTESALNNITGYYFTNYGPDPKLEVVRLDNAVFNFLNAAQLDTSEAWGRVVDQNWQRPKDESGKSINDGAAQTGRNIVYEHLFKLPEQSLKFIGYLRKGDSWLLIELFLRKVLFMEQARIDTYRELGDRLANYALQLENQPISFYHAWSRADKYDKLRRVLRSAAERALKAAAERPLLTYEDFILAFEHPSDSYSQWKLGRDLIAIRMLEVLHRNKVSLEDLPIESVNEDEEEE